ncbi:helix-turn-helix domain-containing protein [Mesorhizobium sp. M0058]|uniref:helix-turn-helix domain-containing protein n=1 Tax=Mesorhizobium sp. M0058 TaxID=2956865 RepID=UPI00333B3108
MSIQKIAWVLDQHVPDPAMKLILISLANCFNEKSGQCNPGFEQLGRETSLSRSTIIRKLKALEDDRWITSESVFTPSGRQTSNSYKIIVARESVTVTPLEGSLDDTLGSVIADTPKEPEERTLVPLTPLAGGTDNRLFDKLISAWPMEHLGKRDVAEREFAVLSEEKRQRASDCALVFLRRCVFQRERVPRLSVYLSSQMFEVIYGAPDVDPTGYYRIHIERPEWRPWLEYVRSKHGEAKAAKCEEAKVILGKTRWPPDYSLASNVTNLAPSVTKMAPASAARG